MDIVVNGKHFEVTDPIREYAEGKIGKSARFYDRVSSAEVLIEKPDSHTYGVEVICHVDGHEHVIAHGSNSDLYACVDDTTAKLERQLHDLKEKERNHKHSAR